MHTIAQIPCGGPLDISELLDHSISFLSESTSDLKACALVARSWVRPAQAYLFKAPKIMYSRDGTTPAVAWQRFYDAVHHSPHLLSYIRQLDLQVGDIYYETCVKICDLPFSHLERVSISGWSSEVGQLLRLPTLRRLRISSFWWGGPSRRAWEDCSLTIRHLELEFLPESSTVPPPPPRAAHIQLHSLRLESQGAAPYRLTQSLRGFDLSHLKALSIGRGVEVNWQEYGPVLRSIQSLDVTVEENQPLIDFTAFPNLSLLRLAVLQPVPPMVYATLSTIAPSHPIHTITIVIVRTFLIENLDVSGCKQLAIKLASLPMRSPLTVKFETHCPHAEASRTFAGLDLGDRHPLVSTVDDTWWERVVSSS
ncbi:hypothetical protein MVEN_01647400 [Mycena venus]|uniref:Uncharacterized protein n=1 Tax=Mycena venus TaxID=2733690 RepID=A0A8H6XQW6_9AGAR|nr:hypothetical protein MVEN_01647400 [Mycena venus]